MSIRNDGMIRHTVAAAATLALLAGCATLEREGALAAAEGGALIVRNGAPMVVSLPPVPDAGFGWILKSTGPGLAFIGGPDVTVNPKPPSVMGVAETTTFRFRAKSPGMSAIEFVYVAPPGQSVATERTVRYTVTVTPAGFAGIL
ncbi:MAG: protease inhibitor I42 family protein [Casimicrobiaceae bacterium]